VESLVDLVGQCDNSWHRPLGKWYDFVPEFTVLVSNRHYLTVSRQPIVF
jgi:hypothetical protein